MTLKPESRVSKCSFMGNSGVKWSTQRSNGTPEHDSILISFLIVYPNLNIKCLVVFTQDRDAGFALY